MKKIVALMFCLMTVISINAQNESVENGPQEVYCMVVAVQKGLFSHKVKITIDYGQSTQFNFWGSQDKQMKLVDKDGKTLKFNSVIDACNYVASLGWTLVSAFPMKDDKQGDAYHYVFKKVLNKGETVHFDTKGNTK